MILNGLRFINLYNLAAKGRIALYNIQKQQQQQKYIQKWIEIQKKTCSGKKEVRGTYVEKPYLQGGVEQVHDIWHRAIRKSLGTGA